MASIIKCKKCGTQNPKINTECFKCGEKLYKETSYNIAITTTVILDIIFIIIYAAAIFLFIDTTVNVNSDNMFLLQNLPFPGSLMFYILILYFILNAIIKILFILNNYVFKKDILIKLRRIEMYFEVITMFPLQLILALYFYNIATKKEANKNGNA